MKAIKLTDFRQNMKEHLQRMEDDKDIIIVSDSKIKDFVVMPIEEYESFKETFYLLSSPSNAQRLMQGLEQSKLISLTPLPTKS